ncbi:thiopurine S-methyltransferase [Legionella worsleiensis]|uniref:Thiopurine S-methyltransferase n=1 Tax=Legionella worsleiensis TaxID=45076 RepID=A0A0W1A9L5_9GAMM|nr:thiopurine S-methyltransferase [Legionella worsleiensis]KTD77990.1 thiopurine S-methyltransferase [Legionella worsleiensis]STY31535.1 thiopurine S-methyltransferase [Legionella worsleiensis]
MDKDYWHQKWQSKSIGFHQAQPNKLMQRYISSLQLAPGACVFVPLCGKSIDMIWLAAQGYQIIGNELDNNACSDFFTENQIPVQVTPMNDFIVYESANIRIFCGDFFNMNRSILGKIHAVYDRAALIALPKEMRIKYSEQITRLTTASTPILLLTTEYNQDEMQGPPFAVGKEEIITLYGTHFNVHQLYCKSFTIPDHLQEKGLTKATEQVYLMTRLQTDL